jgi:hypothetical protein
MLAFAHFLDKVCVARAKLGLRNTLRSRELVVRRAATRALSVHVIPLTLEAVSQVAQFVANLHGTAPHRTP